MKVHELEAVRPWIGEAIAVAFLAPYVYWNATNGWPTPEFWGEYGGKVDAASPVEFLLEQIVTMQPPALPLWLAGLGFYLFAREGRPYRALGWVYIVLFALFAALDTRFYFLAPAYPMLFAAGALRSSGSSWGAVAGFGPCQLTRRCWR